ncbi:MAG: SusD/RagB family nutrient-binding outer membrane lipoprotein [Bacteroidetes bacterium]|nr:SusD/RagB family nutrient-binding outer membrane lipoprotein [Bacteroidota bacterium]
MKNKIKNIKTKAVKGIIILFALLIIIPSCDDRFEEMNKNPNAITEIPDDFLFASLVRNTVKGGMGRYQEDYGAQYAHQAISNTWNKSIDQYNDFHAQGDVTEGMFREIYQSSSKYVNDIIAINSEGENVNEVRIAMAKILAVVNYAKLTDYFGDVPYFEGGMGKNEIYLPKYDPQQEIYADMVEQLKVQMDILMVADPANAYPGQDPMYYNDLDKWVRFANSFRLRLAMRARFVDPGTYEPIIIDCLGQPLIEEINQSAGIEHQDSENSELYNPWFNKTLDYQAGTYQFNVSEKFVDWLKLTSDPRLEPLVKPNPVGEFVGMPNGIVDEQIGNFTRSQISVPGDLMLEPDQPLYIMCASEIWLLRAEAALYGIGTGGDAAALYQKGVEKGMERWGIDATDYLANSSEGTLTGTDEEKFEQIATQMWVSFVPNYQEAWSNIRRTGYPVIAQRTGSLLSKGVTNGYLPKRLKYPYTVEKTLNGVNMQEAIDRMGGDEIFTPVWWDVRD